jgi:hypothetical protein
MDYPSYPAPDPGAPYGRDPATGKPLSRLDVLIDAITRTIVSSQADEREG